MLSTLYCDDIGMPGEGADSEVPAVAGEVRLLIQPDPGGFRPSGRADLMLTNTEFDTVVGDEPEVWRLEHLEWQNVQVGWFAG
jgi:hypothetical protein